MGKQYFLANGAELLNNGHQTPFSQNEFGIQRHFQVGKSYPSLIKWYRKISKAPPSDHMTFVRHACRPVRMNLAHL